MDLSFLVTFASSTGDQKLETAAVTAATTPHRYDIVPSHSLQADVFSRRRSGEPGLARTAATESLQGKRFMAVANIDIMNGDLQSAPPIFKVNPRSVVVPAWIAAQAVDEAVALARHHVTATKLRKCRLAHHPLPSRPSSSVELDTDIGPRTNVHL